MRSVLLLGSEMWKLRPRDVAEVAKVTGLLVSDR